MFKTQSQSMASPRVKNVSLRAYFCLPFHVITYIRLREELKREQKK